MGNLISFDRQSFKKEFGLIMVGAIVFTASFLWKDLITDFENLYFPRSEGIFDRIIFTLVVTAILVVFIIYLKNELGLNKSNNNQIRFDDGPLDDVDEQQALAGDEFNQINLLEDIHSGSAL